MSSDPNNEDFSSKPPSDSSPSGADASDGAEDSFSADFAKLEAELEEAKSRSLRVMADFQNYQRRAVHNEQTARIEGAARVASSVVTVIDHFDNALAQDLSKASPQQVLAGVQAIRDELLKILSQHGVSIIRPSPNDEFTPGRHEAVMQQPSDGIEPGRIVSTFQAGYALAIPTGERVLRPAKVSVAPSV